MIKNNQHYDDVSDAWTHIMGDNLHFGYFEHKTHSLNKATDSLTDKLASLTSINEDSLILDVGCGVGNPAFYLYNKFRPKITGISTSKRGVDLANENCQKKGFANNIKFIVADAINNNLPSNSFDIIWIMEASHLIRDKEKLFKESFRLLKNNGIVLLCDLILIKEFSVTDIFDYQKELQTLENSFGKAKMETLAFYKDRLRKNNFIDVETFDISHKTIQTLYKWKENAHLNKDKVMQYLSQEKLNEFILSCDILIKLFKDEILGYGMLKAVKNI